MKFNEIRNRAIYEAREKGAKYSAIAKEYGLSKDRVRQIHERYKRKLARESHPDELTEILMAYGLGDDTRIYNALKRFEINTGKKATSLTGEELIKLRNLGAKSVKKLVDAGIVKEYDE